MKEPPKEWRVANGAFIGFTLVSREAERSGAGLPTKTEDWLPYAIDLRQVHVMKQFSFEEPHLTALYHHGEFVACVNASFDDVLPFWIRCKHIYDQPEFRNEMLPLSI